MSRALAEYTVGELMTAPVAIAAPETRLRDALEQMEAFAVRQLPVVDHGRVVGLVTEADLREALGLNLSPAKSKERLDWAVYRVMNEQFPSLSAQQPLARAVDLLLEHKHGAIPVVDGKGELSGILSVVDVLKVLRSFLG